MILECSDTTLTLLLLLQCFRLDLALSELLFDFYFQTNINMLVIYSLRREEVSLLACLGRCLLVSQASWID